MRVIFTKKDPRAGMEVELEERQAQAFIDGGWAERVDAAPGNKAEPKPQNKAEPAAPDNKAKTAKAKK